MDGSSAAQVLTQGALSALTGTPAPVVLLQVVSGLSRLVTPADVASVMKGLEEAIEALAKLGHPAMQEPSQREYDCGRDVGQRDPYFDQTASGPETPEQGAAPPTVEPGP